MGRGHTDMFYVVYVGILAHTDVYISNNWDASHVSKGGNLK